MEHLRGTALSLGLVGLKITAMRKRGQQNPRELAGKQAWPSSLHRTRRKLDARMGTFLPSEIILRKRDGQTLSHDEIAFMVR
jgi:hypothetical protein